MKKGRDLEFFKHINNLKALSNKLDKLRDYKGFTRRQRQMIKDTAIVSCAVWYDIMKSLSVNEKEILCNLKNPKTVTYKSK